MINLNKMTSILLIVFLCSTIIQITHVIGRVFFMEFFLLIFLGLIFYSNTKITGKIAPVFCILSALVLGGIISSIVIGELVLFNWIFYALLVACMICIGFNLSDRQFHSVLFYFILFHILFQSLGLLFGSKDFLIGFQGFFHNPNNFSIFSAYCFFLTSILLIDGYKKYFSIFSLIFCFIMVVISASRLSLFLVFITLIFIYFYNYFVLKGFKKPIYYFIPIFSILLFSFFYFIGGFDEIINKSQTVNDSDNITNGRFDLWVNAYNNLNLWGNGSKYYNEGDSSTHNNYLHIGAVYGLICLFSFSFLYLYVLIQKIYRVILYKKVLDFYVFFSFMFAILFWIFEIGSSLFFVWISFLIYGYSLKVSKS